MFKTVFQGSRLREAREARGLTAASLADLLGISRPMMSLLESDDRSPTAAMVARISELLNLPAAFFMTGTPSPSRPLFWRSRAAATKTSRQKIARLYLWLRDIIEVIESYVDFPATNFPAFDIPQNPIDLQDHDIDGFAEKAREFWKLGKGPISDVVALLENQGAIVLRNELGDEKLDAFSEWDRGRCYIVLGSDKDSAARSRIDVAHELAHMLLHRSVPEQLSKRAEVHKVMELQAARFATAFLLPAETFPSELYNVSVDSLAAAKPRWKVSVAAMVMRLADLGMVDEVQKQRLMIQISRRGWRRREPWDDNIAVEQPMLIRRSVDLLLDNGLIHPSELTLRTRYSQTDIEKLLGLSVGYLNEPPASIPIGLKIAGPKPIQEA